MNPRLAIYAALFLGLTALIAYAKYEHSRAERLDGEARTYKATLIAERLARKHEKEIADAATDQFHRNIETLQADLARRPLKPVVIRVPVHALPQADSPAGAASGANEGAQGREHGEVEKDIGPELEAYSLDCQWNAAQLEALHNWIQLR